MRNLLIVTMLAGLTGIAACTSTERGAVVGGATGAAIGGIATGDVGGAVVGGAAGAVAGALIGRASEPGMCVYRDRRGNRYTARC